MKEELFDFYLKETARAAAEISRCRELRFFDLCSISYVGIQAKVGIKLH